MKLNPFHKGFLLLLTVLLVQTNCTKSYAQEEETKNSDKQEQAEQKTEENKEKVDVAVDPKVEDAIENKVEEKLKGKTTLSQEDFNELEKEVANDLTKADDAAKEEGKESPILITPREEDYANDVLVDEYGDPIETQIPQTETKSQNPNAVTVNAGGYIDLILRHSSGFGVDFGGRLTFSKKTLDWFGDSKLRTENFKLSLALDVGIIGTNKNANQLQKFKVDLRTTFDNNKPFILKRLAQKIIFGVAIEHNIPLNINLQVLGYAGIEVAGTNGAKTVSGAFRPLVYAGGGSYNSASKSASGKSQLIYGAPVLLAGGAELEGSACIPLKDHLKQRFCFQGQVAAMFAWLIPQGLIDITGGVNYAVNFSNNVDAKNIANTFEVGAKAGVRARGDLIGNWGGDASASFLTITIK